jgi:hypothetical protein
VVEVEIGECVETESAGEFERDEVAADAQKLLAGRRCLHVHQHYGSRGDAGRCQSSCVTLLSQEQKRRKWVVAGVLLRRSMHEAFCQ